jgi:hypothetical protein
LNATHFFSEQKVTLEKGQAKRDNEAIVRSPPIAETRTRLHALRVDSATAGGEGLRRDEEPLVYWSVMFMGAVIAGFLIHKGLQS